MVTVVFVFVVAIVRGQSVVGVGCVFGSAPDDEK